MTSNWQGNFLTSIVVLVFFALVLILPGIDRDIATDHEGQRGYPPQEMFLTGDWIVPRLNHEPYLKKPPLIYWHTAASYSLFGINEAAARLPSALAGIAVLLVVSTWAWQAFADRRIAFLAGLVAATNLLILDRARQSQIDIHLCLWVLVTLWAWWHAFRRLDQARAATAPILLGGAALALANMYKFPVPYAFVLPAMLLPPLFRGRWRHLLRWEWPAAHLLGLLPFALWCLAVVDAVGWHEASSTLREEARLRIQPTPIQTEPLWFYGMVTLGAFAPFSLLFLRFLEKPVRHRLGRHSLTPAYLLASGVAPVLILSVVPAKESIYMVSAVPALALLLAFAGVDWALRDNAPRWRWRLLLSPLLFFPLVYVPLALRDGHLRTIDRSLRHYATVMNDEAASGRPVAIFGEPRPFLLFYLGHPVADVDHHDIGAYLAHHPGALLFMSRKRFGDMGHISRYHRQGIVFDEVAREKYVLVPALTPGIEPPVPWSWVHWEGGPLDSDSDDIPIADPELDDTPAKEPT